jgi:hypothetical protein
VVRSRDHRRPTGPGCQLCRGAEAAAQYRRDSRADNTRRAYRAAVARFCDRCTIYDQTALPAAPKTVAAFLAAEAGSGRAVNTLRGRHATIPLPASVVVDYPSRTAVALVATTFAGIKRAHRRPLVKKTAPVYATLAAAIAMIPAPYRDCAIAPCSWSDLPRRSGPAKSATSGSTTSQITPMASNSFSSGAKTIRTPRAPGSGCRRAAPNSVRFPPSPPGSPPPKLPSGHCPADLAAAAAAPGAHDDSRHPPLSRRPRPDRHRLDRVDRPSMDRCSRA